MRCIAPRCAIPAPPGHLFCAGHAAAPAGQRGGWLSSYKRKLAMAEHETDPLDASNVFPHLWVGARPPVDRRLERFAVVVLCAREYQPDLVRWACAPHGVIRVPLVDDVPDRNEIAAAAGAARQVATVLAAPRRPARASVLVTCHAGRNRSAWVAAMAMLMVTPRMTPAEAIAMIRERRSPDCLSNPAFVAILHKLWRRRDRARTTSPPPPGPPVSSDPEPE